MANFSGKNVLITGASRGIGSSIAKELSNSGIKVWVNYRSGKGEAQMLVNEIKKNGGDADIIAFDVSKEEEFINAIKTIVETDGGLGYLVNNAGITNDKLSIRMKLEDFNSVIDANLVSTFIGCREALKVMSKARVGAIVNISSIVAETGNAGQVNYTASKGGVISMTKSFAQEGASRSVRFNCVAPGFIATAMTDKLPNSVKEEYSKKIPLGKMGEAEDIAKAVSFLLSDDAKYITGEVLKVNGGMYM